MTAAYGAGPRDLGSGGGWFCEMRRLLQALVPLLFVVLLVAEQLEPRPLGLGPQVSVKVQDPRIPCQKLGPTLGELSVRATVRLLAQPPHGVQ
jgi:energy-converting hydrogenase Eha subunit F